jgi:hypothetical protein
MSERIVSTSIDKNGNFAVATTMKVYRFFRDSMFMSTEGGNGENEEAHHFVGKWRDGEIYSDFFGLVTDELGIIPKNIMKTPAFRSWQERFPRTEECPIDDW